MNINDVFLGARNIVSNIPCKEYNDPLDFFNGFMNPMTSFDESVVHFWVNSDTYLRGCYGRKVLAFKKFFIWSTLAEVKPVTSPHFTAWARRHQSIHT